MLDISVVINTRNQPDELRLCLAALEAQTLDPARWEIVVVDDGSDDTGAVGIVDAYTGKSPCRVIPQDHIGRAAARNVGVSAARGAYVLFLGDDVLAAPDLLERHLRAHRQYDPVAVIGLTEWTPECGPEALREWVDNRAVSEIQDSLNVSFTYFYTGNASVERRLLLDIGGFDEKFIVCGWEDIDLGLRLEKWGVRLIYRADAFATHNHPRMTLDELCRREYEKAFSAVYFFEKWADEPMAQRLRFWEGPPNRVKPGSRLLRRWRRGMLRLSGGMAASKRSRRCERLLQSHRMEGLREGARYYLKTLEQFHAGTLARAECVRSFQGIQPESLVRSMQKNTIEGKDAPQSG